MRTQFSSVFLLLWFVAFRVSGFSISITEDGSNLPDEFGLVVSRYMNGQIVVLDTIKVRSLPFSTDIEVLDQTPGLFFLQVSKEANRVEFIWSPLEDRDIRVETNYWSLRNGFAEISGSKENQAYSLLINAKNIVDARTEDIEMKLHSISAFDNDYKRQMAVYEDSIEFLAFEFNIQLQVLAMQFPKTFTGTTLVGLNQVPSRKSNPEWSKEYDGYLALMNEHYFDFIDQMNPYLLNHYALEDKVVVYLDKYTLKTTDGAEKGIDVIMNSFSENPEVRSFVYNLLLKNFINFKTETLARYLIDRHADGCALNLSVQDLKRLTEMQSLMEGGILPNVNLLDATDQPRDLKRYAEKNRYTIVYVWVSWCVKCQGQSPKIAALFKAFRKKGLGVYAISLDESKQDWQSALQNLNADYPNVCELVPIKNSSVAPRYGISTTPKIFIIDSQNRIVAKDIYGNQLDEKVRSLFSGK